MPVIYKPIQSTLPNKEGKKLFHPRVVLTGNVGIGVVAKEIAELSSLSEGDTRNVIANLITVLTRHLHASESVTLEDLGTFRLAMKSNQKGVEEAADVSASQASLVVRFSPAATRNLDRTIATRTMITGAKCVRFDLKDTLATGGGGSTEGGNTGGATGGEDGDDPIA